MFHSTRGTKLYSSADAILMGLAPDGGLFIPEKIPFLNINEVLELDYMTLSTKILSLYFEDFTYDELDLCVRTGYSSFDINTVVELKDLNEFGFLELFHGPTLAFKDLALVILPGLMEIAKKKKNDIRPLHILTATSGDTGGAALSGFKSSKNIDIVVLYPENGVSEVQERQMLSFKSDKSHVIAVKGNFDDCQSIVKEFIKEHKNLNISSANSINIGRLVPQIIYYFYSYILLVKSKKISCGDLINFVVPTGNFGDIFAGFLAKQMGLPINKLICASNKNKVLTDFFYSKIYDKKRTFYKTNSPSMDILVSSNLERYLYYKSFKDCEIIKKVMKQLDEDGKYSFDFKMDDIASFYTEESKTIDCIKDVYSNYNYLIDPHTAVAYSCYKKYILSSNNRLYSVILSTASPYKFPKTIIESLKLDDSCSLENKLEEISNYTNTKIPNLLSYKPIDKEIWERNEVKKRLEEVLK